jgi:hypothetical protein
LRTSEIWSMASDGSWRSVLCHVPIWLSASGSRPAFAEEGDSPVPDQVLVVQCGVEGDICATVMRPDDSIAALSINGCDKGPGLHLLRHGDRFTVDGRELWVSVRTAHDHVPYDPERHGEPAFCARTKSRLRAGEPIVVCAGTPATDCGMRYTDAAWATGIPCHGCGASLDASSWSPPRVPAGGCLEDLLRETLER